MLKDYFIREYKEDYWNKYEWNSSSFDGRMVEILGFLD